MMIRVFTDAPSHFFDRPDLRADEARGHQRGQISDLAASNHESRTFVQAGDLWLRRCFGLTHARLARRASSSAKPPRGGDAKPEVSPFPRGEIARPQSPEGRPVEPQRRRAGATRGPHK